MAEPARGALDRLVRDLLFQAMAFGRIAAVARIPLGDVFENDVVRRLNLVQNLLALPRPPPDPAFLGAGHPFIYNTARWPAGCPIAGWFGDGQALPQRDYPTSVVTFWHLQIRNPDAAKWKIVRAALYVHQRHGFLAALRYIVDLHRAGLTLDAEHSEAALSILLDARRRVANDHELAALLLVAVPAGEDAWLHAAFRQSPPSGDHVRPDLRDDLDYLVHRAEREIQDVLDAPDYDRWVLGQSFLRALNLAVVRIGKAHGLTRELAFSAALVRIEEILADANGMFAVLAFSGNDPLESPYRFDSTMLDALRRQLGGFDDWRERLIDERAVIPDRLHDLLLADRPMIESLPPEWKRLSAAVAPIVGPLAFGDDGFAMRRIRRFATDEAVRLLPGLDLAAIHPRLDAETAAGLIELVAGKGGRLGDKAAPAAEGEGDLDQLERLFRDHRIFLNGMVDAGWHAALCAKLDVEPDRLEAVTVGLYRGLCAAEIRMLAAASFAGESADDEPLDALVAHYPYYAPGLVEKGLRLDLAGDGEAALALMRDGILLNPFDPDPWHCLAVALGTKGEQADALVCEAVANVLSEGG